MSTRGRGRPPVTTHEAVEETALALFEERGVENTTVVDIAEACEMSKTSFFRYFASKNEILWRPFDEHVERIREGLADQPEDRPVTAAIDDALRAALTSEVDIAGVWLRRLRFQSAPDQQAVAAEHWARWTQLMARFIRVRSEPAEDDLLPETVAGAVTGTFTAFVRILVVRHQISPDEVLARYDEKVSPIIRELQPFVERIER
ncbi:TetR/AcrR family transcriptional regulator [Gulosibacter sp. 10]|uniref:TetR/AcrR family transcriptional regulator n=1 Tax=Gulosibacter sp. 10 TaxID=1255570 RepID=UPI00097F1685|nr:TetR/AcrR family transcriptional regulator [Gulosibacter sp. 10]SJM65292.1 Mycofactocin system transcriptional regulator [Gulosibacter sp. 10]